MRSAPPPKFEPERLDAQIRKTYAGLASDPPGRYPFFCGVDLARTLRYDSRELVQVPAVALAAFCGAGNPFLAGSIRRGDAVLDVGCGSGVDVFIAGRKIGRNGRVVGIDMTPEMVDRARAALGEISASRALHPVPEANGAREDEAAREADLPPVEFIMGRAEELPFEDDTFDAALMNNVLNMCLHKPDVLCEIRRVLKPGGRLHVADLLTEKPILEWARDLVHLWTECVGGSLPTSDYLELLRASGFADVGIIASHDVITGAPVEGTAGYYKSAGYTIRGQKPA